MRLELSRLSGVVNKDHICRFLKCILVVLDGGNGRVDSVMCVCARFGTKLVRGESVVEHSVCRKSSSVFVVSRRRPSKSLGKVSLRYMPL